jgi:hypothetical protein
MLRVGEEAVESQVRSHTCTNSDQFRMSYVTRET